MKAIRTALVAVILGFGAFTFATVPTHAGEKAKIQKCDKEGAVCTTGKDCKPANCKGKKK